ncbi:[FeFe] hydrogenase H-cluster radical SAM maturase HydG [Fuchsiella alkaliacetigena]|uniref:[FeFe] hydrogenase H-cluster radical SAM maturase HydG n=1 Tax=Fuchsiella alkaliacetigena TaxID=957042 RepID=UPI00200A8A62|nr:[FeFe] hydrogenase H-cluster radical SAM maturase HydG [Fuchsiella alkaliacetigena]MCK8825757.1 [FeFe] hydrogenase H-cluster radical SAM maturase HydG [Fuchsiella alkaliacetigena]
MPTNFIKAEKLKSILASAKPTAEKIEQVINKALNKERLSLTETALLLKAEKKDWIDKIFAAAKKLKQIIYGDRVVLFAPLYIGNKCINNCQYCGFKASNTEVQRCTLSDKEIETQVKALENQGQKRLILVYGEHPDYDAEFIAHTVKLVYQTKEELGEIRRVNINAAPLKVADYRQLKEVGIGTYQIFQETYHPPTYQRLHPSGPKADFQWRITGLDRAMQAGLDDVGIGALFGLYNWKYEVLGLLAHTEHLEENYGVGPHTISFPRLNPATNVELDEEYLVNDEEFKRLVAILRLAVPYTGLILTAREKAELRREVMELGVSQIDAGTRIEMKGYTKTETKQNLNKEQFKLGDTRSLEAVIHELINDGYLPSFCTACYRLGRTGEHFMEFATPGFIKRYCTPNALLTFKEYLEDYASQRNQEIGQKLLKQKLTAIKKPALQREIKKKLERIENGARDLCF